MTTGSKPRAPAHLTAATKRWWREVAGEYDLEHHHLHLLTLAGEAWDRAGQARELLESDGITVLDRFGVARAHPAVAIERDSAIRFARLIRELDLEGEPAPDPRMPQRRR